MNRTQLRWFVVIGLCLLSIVFVRCQSNNNSAQGSIHAVLAGRWKGFLVSVPDGYDKNKFSPEETLEFVNDETLYLGKTSESYGYTITKYSYVVVKGDVMRVMEPRIGEQEWKFSHDGKNLFIDFPLFNSQDHITYQYQKKFHINWWTLATLLVIPIWGVITIKLDKFVRWLEPEELKSSPILERVNIYIIILMVGLGIVCSVYLVPGISNRIRDPWLSIYLLEINVALSILFVKILRKFYKKKTNYKIYAVMYFCFFGISMNVILILLSLVWLIL